VHVLQQPYRALYDDFYDYEGADFYDDLVPQWLRRQDGERRWLEELGNRRGDPIPAATIEELWRLYALAHRRPRLLFGGAVAWRTRRSARPRSTRGSSMGVTTERAIGETTPRYRVFELPRTSARRPRPALRGDAARHVLHGGGAALAVDECAVHQEHRFSPLHRAADPAQIADSRPACIRCSSGRRRRCRRPCESVC